MSTDMTTAGGQGGPSGTTVQAKGLRAGILDLGDSVMLGLASTAPVYSLAATLGLIVAVNGNYTPFVLLLGFIPVLFIAYAFRELNSAMPDCGTTFTWSRRAFGPWAGWMGGWGVALAGIVVLANLAQVAGQYLWLLIGDGSLAQNKLVVTGTGVLFIVLMTLVNYRGIRLGEHVQRVLTYVQYIALGIFALAIVIRITAGPPEGQAFDFEWFNPVGAFADPGAVVHGSLLALFIYWGWDTCLALNEETENPSKTPGRGAVISAFVLVAIYVSVALLVMMYATVGSDGIGLGNEANQADVFLAMKDVVLGPWGWLIVVAVLASVLSSTQTTILPTARGTLSMGDARGAAAQVRRSAPPQPDARLLHQGDGRGGRGLLRGHELPQREPAGRFHQRHQPVHRLLLRADRVRLLLVFPRNAPRIGTRPVVPWHPPAAGRAAPHGGVLHLCRPDVGPGLRRYADLRRRRCVRQRRGAAGPGRGARRRLPVPALHPRLLPGEAMTA